MVKAIYGVPGDAQRTRNVTAKVQKLIDADKTTFPVAEMAQGDDPAEQVVKTLEIDYTVNGKPFHVRGKDADVIQLPTRFGGKSYVVQSAIYGVPGDAARSRDVKTAVQNLVDKGVTSFEVASMAAGDDPAFGVVKTLTVQFTVDGKPHTASGEDPETIDLSPEVIANAKCPATLSGAAEGGVLLEAWQNGRFELTTAAGHKLAGACRIFRLPRLWWGLGR